MSGTEVSSLDAEATLLFARAAQAGEQRAQVEQLVAAAHWADLHGVLDRPGAALPGCERLVLVGGVGTPEVAEFCTAELGAVLGMSDFAASRLVADGLDLRHRLPRLWGRVQAGEVKAWVGRKTAEATRQLSVETCVVVDRRVAPFADRVSWSRLDTIIGAAWSRSGIS
jgi:hypothetical protein